MRLHRLARFIAVLLFVAAVIYFAGGVAIASILWSRGLGAGWGAGFTGWIAIPILISALFGALMLLMVGAVLYFLAHIDMNLSRARQNARPRSIRPLPAATEPASTEHALVVPAAEPQPDEPINVTPLADTATPVIATGIAIGAGATTSVDAEKAPLEPPDIAGATPVIEPPAVEIASPDIAVAAPVVEMTKPEVEVGALELPDVEVEVAEDMTPALAAAPQAVEPVQPSLQAELPEIAEEAAPENFAGRLPGANEIARIASEMAAINNNLPKP